MENYDENGAPIPEPKQKDVTEEMFTYHRPTDEQVQELKIIRMAGKALARAIKQNCPLCEDTDAAIEKTREAVMFANASIVLDGLV